MRVIEAEAKAMLARRGIATPVPSRIYRQDDVVAPWPGPVAIKAQTLSGKRAEAGLVRLAPGSDVPELVAQIRDRMCASHLLPVVLVEGQADIAAEYYMAWRIDDLAQGYELMVSTAGGSDIEDRGDTLHRFAQSPLRDLHPHQLASFLKNSGMPAAHVGPCARFATSLFDAMRQEDAVLLEINPMVITGKGQAVAVDAKLVFDDAAAKRHREHAELISADLQTNEHTALEGVAAQAGFTFVELDGRVAVYSAGAGLGMCLLDMLADADVPAANFSDASGGSSAEVFASMGRVVFTLAERDGVDAILLFFVLAATSLKSVVDGIVQLIDSGTPPKPLVVGLIAAGAAEREMTLNEAQALIEARGYACVTSLTDAVCAVRAIVHPQGSQS